MAKRPAPRNPAVEALKEKMSRDPFSRAFLQLAEEYRRQGEYDEAIKICLEGLQRHPAYHTARIALGRTYLEAGRLEEARSAFSEVVAIAPENHLAAKLLAEVQRKMGDAPGAVETYRTILTHYPGDAEVKALLQDLVTGATAAPAAPVATRPGDPVLDYHSADLAAAGLAPPVAGLAPPATPARTVAHPAPKVPAVPPGAPSAARPAAPVVATAPVPATSPVAARTPAASPAMAAARRSAAGTERDADGDGGNQDALQTNTLAELYLRQGLVDRAVEVYRRMLRVDPGNDRARRRLQELAPGGAATGTVGVAAGPPGPPPTPPSAAAPAVSVARPVPAAAMAAGAGDDEAPFVPPAAPLGAPIPAVPTVAHPQTRARIDRIAAWLGRIQAAGREARPL
jgi:pentatricopeptide repeat protein